METREINSEQNSISMETTTIKLYAEITYSQLYATSNYATMQKLT